MPLLVKEVEISNSESISNQKNKEEFTKGDSKENGYSSNFELHLIFKEASKCTHIKNLLVDQGLCQPNTHLWKDEGPGKLGLLAAILKYLHLQGYYKKKIKHDQIKSIAQNTFGLEISIDTIKKSKPEDYDLTFIPLASTLK